MARRLLVVVVVLAAAVVAGGVPLVGVGQPIVQRDQPENLKALLETIQRTIHTQKNPAGGAAMFRSLLPDEARLKRALRAGVDRATVERLLEFYRQVTPRDEEAGALMKASQTIVRVHAALTEEIARYQEGSVAWSAFPGGAKAVAERILRPGVTFYEAEYLEPGRDIGMTYHLFFWSGGQWSMLGPVWRVLK